MSWIWCGRWWSVCVRVSPLHVWGSTLDDSTPYICQRIVPEGVYYVICEANALIMTSALFLVVWGAAQSQSVRRYLNNFKLHGNLERGAHKHVLSVRSAPLLPGFTVSEWLRHGIPHRSGLLLGLHRSNSFHSPYHPLTPSSDPFYLSAMSHR